MATERLISADAFIEDIKTEIMNLYLDGKKGTPRPREELYDIIDRINEQPTVDAVEVSEYDAIVDKLECLLCHATGGRYSRARYSFEDMERMVNDYIEECCEEAVSENVVHGRWENGDCTACGFDIRDLIDGDSDFRGWVWEGLPYCPNCGAKNDGDGNG